jgi:hypothetical protein
MHGASAGVKLKSLTTAELASIFPLPTEGASGWTVLARIFDNRIACDGPARSVSVSTLVVEDGPCEQRE